MPHLIIAFVVGLVLSLEAYLLTVSAGGLLATLMIFKGGISIVRALSLLIIMAFGYQWAEWTIDWQAPKALAHDSMKLDVIGQIQGLIDDDGKSAKFVLESIDPPGHRFKLHWRHPVQSLKENALVNLRVKVKQAHSLGVSGAWDYEGWLYQQGIRYSGYVIKGQLIDAQHGKQSLRSQIRDTLRQSLNRSSGRALLLALLIGDRSELSFDDRRLLTETGLSHLVAISGLHISLIAGLIGGVALFGLRRVPYVVRRLPAMIPAAWLGLVAAIFYAYLAGWQLPTQRAIVMLLVAVVFLTLRRSVMSWHVLAVAALAVLLIDPMALVTASFWLSFVAVAVIGMVWQQTKATRAWQRLVLIQFALAISLYPVLLIFGLTVSSVGPAVNLVAVPLFGLVVMPLLLISVLSAVVDQGFMLSVVADVLSTLMSHLSQLNQQVDRWSFLPSNDLVPLLIFSVLLLLMPILKPIRLLGVVLLLFVHWPVQSGLAESEWRMTMLDVGQGLSMLIETQDHRLLYDVGAKYPSGFNMADAAVAPYWRHKGLRDLDMLMLSHGDNDHAGAYNDLFRQVTPSLIFSGEPDRTSDQHQPCYRDQQWQWDGVTFRVLSPEKNSAAKGNNASCVLLIESAHGRALLLGDAERTVEKRLAPEFSGVAPIDIVIAGHHGSASSSSTELIKAVNAKEVWFSAGYLNRYRFPKKDVLARWELAKVRGCRTDLEGTLKHTFKAQPSQTSTYWETARKPWHNSVSPLAPSEHAVSSVSE
jgi:competence protein ComEC